MKTHRWILHGAIQARSVPLDGSTGAPRTDPLVGAARGILILALVLGSLGADALASSGYGNGDHASAHQSAGNVHPAARAYSISFSNIENRPWMY